MPGGNALGKSRKQVVSLNVHTVILSDRPKPGARTLLLLSGVLIGLVFLTWLLDIIPFFVYQGQNFNDVNHCHDPRCIFPFAWEGFGNLLYFISFFVWIFALIGLLPFSLVLSFLLGGKIRSLNKRAASMYFGLLGVVWLTAQSFYFFAWRIWGWLID
jgi:hypothetical protein